MCSFISQFIRTAVRPRWDVHRTRPSRGGQSISLRHQVRSTPMICGKQHDGRSPRKAMPYLTWRGDCWISRSSHPDPRSPRPGMHLSRTTTTPIHRDWWVVEGTRRSRARGCTYPQIGQDFASATLTHSQASQQLGHRVQSRQSSEEGDSRIIWGLPGSGSITGQGRLSQLNRTEIRNV